jgi:hypothetical protein
MPEHLLVLAEPLVYLLPAERRVPGEEGGRGDRLAVRPDRVGLEAASDADRAVRRRALVRAPRPAVARLEQLVPQVLLRHVVHGEVPRLVQELRADRVEHGLPGEKPRSRYGTGSRKSTEAVGGSGVKLKRRRAGRRTAHCRT